MSVIGGACWFGLRRPGEHALVCCSAVVAVAACAGLLLAVRSRSPWWALVARAVFFMSVFVELLGVYWVIWLLVVFACLPHAIRLLVQEDSELPA